MTADRKPIDPVMADAADPVTVRHTLRQNVDVKATDSDAMDAAPRLWHPFRPVGTGPRGGVGRR